MRSSCPFYRFGGSRQRNQAEGVCGRDLSETKTCFSVTDARNLVNIKSSGNTLYCDAVIDPRGMLIVIMSTITYPEVLVRRETCLTL